MNEMSEHLNSFFSSEFVSFLFHFFSFLAKCRMQMLCPNYANEIPWSVLPMWYVLYAIDRLLTIDLDVNFSMNAKCDASLDFFDANASLWICGCECFDANTIYSKILFVFEIKASQRLKQQYFQILICYFSKSHLLLF